MSWLTKFLGFDEIIVAKDGEIVNLYTQLHRKDEQLAMKDEEIRRLTDLMLVEHGVISREPDARTTQPAKPQPIGRRASFRTIRNKFEAADAKVAQEISKDQVEKLREYWGNKDQIAQQEGVL